MTIVTECVCCKWLEVDGIRAWVSAPTDHRTRAHTQTPYEKIVTTDISNKIGLIVFFFVKRHS